MSTDVAGLCQTIVFNKSPSADRQHLCRVCSKAFKRSEHRLRHERAHTREKPFQCRYCHKSYARRDLVSRHEKTLHPSKYIAVLDSHRTGPKDKRAPNDDSDQAGQNNAVLFGVDGESPKSGSLTGEDSSEVVIPSRSCDEPTLVFPADSNSSARNQHFDFNLPGDALDRADGDMNRSQSGIEAVRNSTHMHAFSSASAIANDKHTTSASEQQQTNLLMQEASLDQLQAIAAAPPQDFNFTKLDFFDPYLGLTYDTLDLFNFHDELGQAGTFSPLDQLADVASHHTGNANQHLIMTDNISPFTSHSSMSDMPLETTMAEAQSKVNALTQNTELAEAPIALPKPSPASIKTSTSSLPEVVRTSKAKRAHFQISQATRTALYRDLTTRLTQDDLWDFDFPEAPVIEKCLSSYFDAFHVHLPVIHFPTLILDETPGPLILIMCAIGALYRLERRLATNMYRKASQAFTGSMTSWLAINESLLIIDEFKPQEEEMPHPASLPLWMTQTRLLLAVFGTLNGNAGLIKRAFGLLGAQWIDCHMTISALSVTEEVRERKWRFWVERESSKRIFYGILILSHMLSTAYGLSPAFSAAQLATLAMPGDQDLWDAPSEAQWLMLQRDRSETTPLSLGEAVSKLMYDRSAKEFPDASMKWSPLATAVAMYAVATQVWHISSARNLGIVRGEDGFHTTFPSPGDIAQTEAALGRCRELLISAKKSDDSTWSDDEEPMLFNCMAVLRVAYGRACMLTATLDRFILLRETRGEIRDAIKRYLSIDQPRSESITKAVARSVEGLFIPIQAGMLWTQKTAALTWWVDHALAGWDTALFVTRWIHAIEQAEQHHRPIDDLEKKTINEVHRLMKEARIQWTSNNSLAAAVARYWATFFTDTWVWGVTPRIGFVIQELARAYEEAWVLYRHQS